MRYIHPNYDVVIHAAGGFTILEQMGFKSENQIALIEKKEREKLAFQETLKKTWICPDCKKEMPEISRTKHHIWHQQHRLNRNVG